MVRPHLLGVAGDGRALGKHVTDDDHPLAIEPQLVLDRSIRAHNPFAVVEHDEDGMGCLALPHRRDFVTPLQLHSSRRVLRHVVARSHLRELGMQHLDDAAHRRSRVGQNDHGLHRRRDRRREHR